MKAVTDVDKVHRIRDRLRGAQHVVVLTGAGISAESGVPTFRGEGGLWREYRAVDLATPQAFQRDPRLVWEFYNWRREVLAPLSPNPGHEALVRLEQRVPRFTLITQNIDGLHEKAGSHNILELHGNIWHVRCPGCGTVTEDRRVLPPMPLCAGCGQLLRPHVVWFGENLDPAILTRAYEAVQRTDFMMIVGTSGTVEPAASMGMLAKRKGAWLVEVNLEATPHTSFYDASILGKSGEILPLICEAL
ncbi:MAG: NAD-dependent deacylase [Syntrophobacteraceae bacterium]|jgi:NAD-dependent deacetylase|nr:NAD-dependent deacylase [Syntrophobacteraceae bacterium]